MAPMRIVAILFLLVEIPDQVGNDGRETIGLTENAPSGAVWSVNETCDSKLK